MRPVHSLVLAAVAAAASAQPSALSLPEVDSAQGCRAATALLSKASGESADSRRLSPGRRQLFLDNHILEGLTNVTRTLHQPVKHGPVIRPDRAWEGESIQIRTGPSWNPAEKIWMMWYLRGYAASRDGEHWEKPMLGLRDYKGSRENNLMLPFTDYEFTDPSGKRILRQNGDGTTVDNVFYDAKDPDPARRYKGMGYKGPICCLTGGHGMGFYPAVSPDGKQWSLLDSAFVQTGDESHLIHDEERNLYVATVKQAGPYGRSVYLAVSSDFSHWTDPRECLVFHADKRDQDLGAERVRMHLRNPQMRQPVFHNPAEYLTDIYNLAVVPYEGLYIGMPTVFNHSGNTAYNSDGFSMVELAVSRDLIRWERVGNRTKFIPLSPVGSGKNYDVAQLLAGDRPIITDNEIWIYYTGLKWRSRPDDAKPDPEGTGAICLAKLRRDGFVSLDAGDRPGEVLTKEFLFAGQSLHVNVDAGKGELRVEVQDGTTGKVLSGFAEKDATVVTGDRLDAAVTWRGASVASLTGRTLRLRLLLRNAALYSLWAGS
ncbi:MAG: hypothetical protein ACKV22_07840 [Bryobacteraceae bacterium]